MVDTVETLGTDTPEGRGHRARMLACFFFAGAAVSCTAIILPGWPNLHRAGIAVTVVLAVGGAGLLVLLDDRIGRWGCHAFTLAGTALIGASQVLAGGGAATATYGMLYIWVVLHCSLFFTRAAVAAHLALTTAAHVVAVVWLGDLSSMAPQLSLTVGTQIAAALVVGSLASKMRQLADTDALTGLGNRRALDRALSWQLERTRRNPAAMTWVGLLDLDGFKAFNDAHGHLAGDRLLADAAAAWLRLLRPTDMLARTGGDEFTVVVADCDADQAERIMARMAAAVPHSVSCSAGLARWDGREPSSDLIRRADAALYAAKATGPLVVAATLAGKPSGQPETAR